MTERILAQADTLVKYDNPVLQTQQPDKKKEEIGDTGGPTRPKCAPPSADVRREVEEILNAILPPKEWEEDGQAWRQQVSTTPATRLDVISLQEQLDMRLHQRQARETGICPIRRQLYTQCFDEIIRQVTINCAERGLLLLRVRDELKMTMEAYQTLYISSVAFGMRKALLSEQGKADLESNVERLKDEKASLERQLIEQRSKAELAERRFAEQTATSERKHNEEITLLKKTNLQLKSQLEGIIAPKKG
ncbi:axonemal dynein light intermediate polypeptide 1 [Chrysoperla carnea]|uniref:axonemal dynein light intermediate polypeptide 1 n=1 Tax=Chrysoperla carnea TaxID=189513 RepID=UPI001D088C71|nr:axonemal dynein light intermediate polypeptide 1 [Chrysoperla carnea]